MSVASKNLFAYLGNDDDGEEKIPVPVKTVEKQIPGTSKRNAEPKQAPARGPGGNRRGGPGGSEGAFRDRGVGSDRNQGRSTEEQSGNRGSRGGAGARVRGGRGSRHPRDRDDRHPRSTPQGASDKTAAASGATEGEAELKDEQAGEAIAQTEQKEAAAEDAAEEPAEPEDKSVSYADYLAQQAEKKLQLSEGGPKIREANEGSKLDKKWANAKPLENEESDYFTASGGKKQRERERKVKQTVDFDPRYVEPERTGGRGGSRGGRGGRGRGEGRGEGRGARGGNFRGGRGGRDGSAAINTKDESAFPSLGA